MYANKKRGAVFMSRTNRKYSGEEKFKILEDMKINNYSYNETSKIYEIQHSVIRRWERIYLEDGYEGLCEERRGRTTKMENLEIGKPKKLGKQVEEDLIDEVQRLRMENDYLKKLNALVREREILAKKTKHK